MTYTANPASFYPSETLPTCQPTRYSLNDSITDTGINVVFVPEGVDDLVHAARAKNIHEFMTLVKQDNADTRPDRTLTTAYITMEDEAYYQAFHEFVRKAILKPQGKDLEDCLWYDNEGRKTARWNIVSSMAGSQALKDRIANSYFTAGEDTSVDHTHQFGTRTYTESVMMHGTRWLNHYVTVAPQTLMSLEHYHYLLRESRDPQHFHNLIRYLRLNLLRGILKPIHQHTNPSTVVTCLSNYFETYLQLLADKGLGEE